MCRTTKAGNVQQARNTFVFVNLCAKLWCQRGFFRIVTLVRLRMEKLLVFLHILMIAALDSIKPIVKKVGKINATLSAGERAA